ncbi:MAG: hypothetical protein R6U98_33015 [Pirellulaceae bacterium]
MPRKSIRALVLFFVATGVFADDEARSMEIKSTLSGGPACNEREGSILGAPSKQTAVWEEGERQGLLEVKPVHIPPTDAGDCNRYGWPIATMTGDTIVVMRRRIPGHNPEGAGKPNLAMSYGIVLRSEDGGKTWSKPYDLRDCMKPEDRERGGIVPLSHRAKFDQGNKSKEGYKAHFHSIGTLRDGAVVAINNHGVFRSDDAGRTWRHFSTALREEGLAGPAVRPGARIIKVGSDEVVIGFDALGEPRVGDVVARLAEQFWDGFDRQSIAVVVGAVATPFARGALRAVVVRPERGLVHAGDHGGAAGGADRIGDDSVGQADALLGQPINMRRLDGRLAVTPDVGRSVFDDDPRHVWPSGGGFLVRCPCNESRKRHVHAQ